MQANKIIQQLDKVIHGKHEVCALVYASLIAGGHVLLEDVPGVGKTSLAHAVANATGLEYKRVQCTNDTLPSDIIGVSMWNPSENKFVFQHGPIFTQALVVDEINRASPKTQSALLEAMEEQQVSVDNHMYKLPSPFWVIATQNPVDQNGTSPLPESQLDRFLIKVSMGYPDEESEKRMLKRDFDQRRASLSKATTCTIEADRTQAQSLVISDNVIDYVYRLIKETRNTENFKSGLSPRAGQGLIAMAKAWAWLHGKTYVSPDDIKTVFPSVACHRITHLYDHTDVAITNLLNTIEV